MISQSVDRFEHAEINNTKWYKLLENLTKCCPGNGCRTKPTPTTIWWKKRGKKVLTFFACLHSQALTCSKADIVSGASQNLVIGPPLFFGWTDAIFSIVCFCFDWKSRLRRIFQSYRKGERVCCYNSTCSETFKNKQIFLNANSACKLCSYSPGFFIWC